MRKKLKELIDRYSTSRYVDIEQIVKSYGLIIDYVDFDKINWLIIWNRIWINKNISKAKQRFTLAHELCHFLLKDKWTSTGPFAVLEKKENRADEFATIFLLPKWSVLRAWEMHRNISVLANIFEVPQEVMRNRLALLAFEYEA